MYMYMYTLTTLCVVLVIVCDCVWFWWLCVIVCGTVWLCVWFLWSLFCLDYFQSRGVTDPHKYFYRELDTNFTSSTSLLSEIIAKSSLWLESWSVDYLKSKGVKVPRQAPPTKSNLRSTKSQPIMKLPPCDPIDVVNHFVKIEHEKELARLVRLHVASVGACEWRILWVEDIVSGVI